MLIESFTSGDVFINLFAVASDTLAHGFKLTIANLKLAEQLMLSGGLCSCDLDDAVQFFKLERPDGAVCQREFRMIA